MAKKPMVCPFSKRLCRECSFYIGGHYYLCFVKEYRGYLGDKTEVEFPKPLPTHEKLEDSANDFQST